MRKGAGILFLLFAGVGVFVLSRYDFGVPPPPPKKQVFYSASAGAAENNSHPAAAEPRLYGVARVIDGDTIAVVRDGREEKIRLIGIDAPETVDPRKPVQCFGREAAEKMNELVAGQRVAVQTDPSQDSRDKYGRLLAYIFLQDGTNVNKEMVAEGFAHEYTYRVPYRFQPEFRQAERDARQTHKGLWASGACR